MRTTVSLDPDVEALLKRAMSERGLSFKVALNEAVRAGLGTPRSAWASFPIHDMGVPLVPIDKALHLADRLEDAELLHKLDLGK